MNCAVMEDDRTAIGFGNEMPEQPQTFGPNAWLVDEMYEQYRQDPSSVSESWQEFFADYRKDGNGSGGVPRLAADAPAPQAPATAAAPSGGAVQTSAQDQRAETEAAKTGPASSLAGTGVAGTPIRGASARIVENMERSLA